MRATAGQTPPSRPGGDRPSTGRRAGAWVVSLAALLLWGAVLGTITWTRYGGDIRAFICIGTNLRHPPAMAGIPDGGPGGYDGQFYAALATDPFLRDSQTRRCLDVPTYRATRIGVPMAAHVLALGRPGTALAAYVLVIWGLALVAVHLAARWLGATLREVWPAALLALSGGLAASVIRATPDVAAVALILAALTLHRHHRFGAAVTALAAATLTRETSILAAGAIGLVELRDRRVARAAWATAVPAAALAAWQLYLHFRGFPWHDGGAGNFRAPFASLLDKVGDTLREPLATAWPEVAGVAAVLLSLACLAVISWRVTSWSPLEPAFVANALLAAAVSRDVYVEHWSYARSLGILPFLAVLLAGRATSRWRRWTLNGVALLAAVVGLSMLGVEWREALAGRGWLGALREGTARSAAAGSPGVRRLAAATLVVFPATSEPPVGAYGLRRTEVELVNQTATVNQIRLEWYPTAAGQPPDSRVVNLDPRGRVTLRDAVREAFGATGTGALLLVPASGKVAATSRTVGPTTEGVPPAVEAPSLERETVRTGPARFRLPVLVPPPLSRARVEFTAFNPGDAPVRLLVELRDATGTVLGSAPCEAPPRTAAHLADAFPDVAPARLAAATLAVTATGGRGDFLACAAVRDDAAGRVHPATPAGPR